MSPAAFTGTPDPAESRAVRVLIVDDSAIVRGIYTRVIGAEPDLVLVDSAWTAERALTLLQKHRDIDVIILDIEMPGMDGLTALPEILAQSGGARVIMCSTLTRRNAEISIRAMAAGAADYVPKPDSAADLTLDHGFRRELVEKIRALGRSKGLRGAATRPRFALTGAATPAAGASAGLAERWGKPQPAQGPNPIVPGMPFSGQQPGIPGVAAQDPGIRPIPRGFKPEALAIGSSTGGPQALLTLLQGLGPLRLPVVITQHMPVGFTQLLAEHLAKQTGLDVAEAKGGEILQPGQIRIAPGGRHLEMERAIPGGAVTLSLSDAPAENFCRPAVDVMLRAAAKAWGGRVLSVILTGMGQDGLAGCRILAGAGGVVLAQDEATSVVWGMPGAVTRAGLPSAVLPIERLAAQIRRMVGLPQADGERR